MSDYLGVGIHSNIVVTSETKINDKGTFVLGLSQKPSGDMFDAFESGETLTPASANLMLFAPNITDWENKPKTPEQIGQDLNNFKNTLIDVLMMHMTEEKARASITTSAMFQGLGITVENKATLPQRLLQEDFVKAVYLNIANAFIAAVTPFYGANPFRVKLRRTSKAKHFAMIPQKSKYPETWIESMAVPADASKIKWSDYEIKNGLNHGTPVPTNEPAAEESAKVEQMFAAPTGNTTPAAETGSAAPAATTPPDQAAPFAEVQPTSNPFNQ